MDHRSRADPPMPWENTPRARERPRIRPPLLRSHARPYRPRGWLMGFRLARPILYQVLDIGREGRKAEDRVPDLVGGYPVSDRQREEVDQLLRRVPENLGAEE